MRVAEILEAIHLLPEAERCELVAFIENEFFGYTDELTPAQISELERRAADLRQNPESKVTWGNIRAALQDRRQAQPQPPATPSLEQYFSAAKALPFDERVELAHRLWDEFMAGFKDWKVTRLPEGVFAWSALKTEIDAMLNSAGRLELAQQVWRNIQENGYDPGPNAAQIIELERRAEAARKSLDEGVPFEQVFAEIRQRTASPEELKSGEGALIGRRLQEHLEKPEPVISLAEAKARLDAKYGKWEERWPRRW
jgi:putative addiction module component (TIGR02574 family)